VKPQAAAFREKSREFLAKAQGLLDAYHWPENPAGLPPGPAMEPNLMRAGTPAH
jgi:hypothetical protein